MSPQLVAFLTLLFSASFCISMTSPFIGFFLVEGLGSQPWTISVYSGLSVCLTLVVNRQFAKRIDDGGRVFPLVGVSAVAFAIASSALMIMPKLWVIFSFGVVGFGVSLSVISTLFSLGRKLSEERGMERSNFNAYMRATTSTSWITGPAFSFFIADKIGIHAVFSASFVVSLAWIVLWRITLPRGITADYNSAPIQKAKTPSTPIKLWLAAAFVFCLSFAHSVTFTSLPIFLVKEVGLPGFAPGVAFSIKALVEVGAIFATPHLINKFGIRRALMGTSLLAIATIQILSLVGTFPQMVFGAALEGLYYGFYASLGISYVQSFSEDRPARGTALYWNTLMVSLLLAGPTVGFIAQAYDFRTVLYVASGIAALAFLILVASDKIFKYDKKA